MTTTTIRTLLIAVILLAAASLVTASVDLTGEYWFGSLSADVSTNVPWGKRGTVIVDGNEWTQEWDDQDGHHTFSSDFTTTVRPDGSININLSSGAYNVAWNGNVMIHAGTVLGGGGRGIDIFTRKAANVSVNDFIGEYSFFGHWLGADDRWDEVGWGTCKFNANGTVVNPSVYSDGSSDTFKSTWTLDDVNGIGTVAGVTPSFYLGQGGIMTGFRITSDTHSNRDYTFFLKKTTQTITRADMAGTYQVRFLESGPGGVPYTCGQGTFTLRADGTGSVDAYYSDGEHDVKDLSYSVGPGNNINFGNGFKGIISPDKNLIFAPEYTYDNNPREDYDWIGGLFFVREANNTPDLQFGNISGQTNTKITVNDANDVLVTFSLTGGGYGEIVRGGGLNFEQVILYDTGEKSQLTISTKGKTTTSVGDIIVNGSLKGITAKTTSLRGSITVTGSLGTVTLSTVADSHTITIGSSANPKAATAMTFDRVSDLTINSQMPIKSITATDWGDGDINAPSVGSITTKGDKKRGIAGNLDIDVTVPGVINSVKVAGELAGTWDCNIVKSIAVTSTDDFDLTLSHTPDLKIPALGKLTVKEEFGWSQILSSGNIGTITVGEIIDSSCFAGVTTTHDIEGDGGIDNVLDLPDPNTDIDYSEPATIKSIAVKGVKGWGPYFTINSNFAAANILSISLAYPQNDNGGVPFGVAAGYIKKLTIKSADSTISLKELANPGDAGTLPDDVEIRLY